MKKSFTAGSIPRQLATFSFPILLANLLQASMQLINSLWVGNLLGSAAFGAVTVGTTVIIVVLAFVLGINNATLTIFAQLKGSNDQKRINSYLSAFVIILAVLSLIISVTGYVLTEPLLALMNTPASIASEAKAYLQISFIGTFLLVGYNFIGTALRAFGDSKTPLYFVLLATVLATVLDPLFIAGFDLGVAGAAYATVLAQSIAFIYSLFYLSGRFKNTASDSSF
ncbi:MATE family efflux transporter [Paenalcaligenes niemegkensis]|uniref:MATE family efflux transporter n=1 Tax=Paenalcaligenes niemegkensis TaxID=2895469 RepID=UPI001EE91759|nr:MATE family efflux transporter [Paenalcaligenes niemegkensis]MCQ9617428.1 MATE family efflux transporter [Paenalcaligenes niemegkensis]